ncbi:Hypothetical predicted protein, partial [Pelobates cultripes]
FTLTIICQFLIEMQSDKVSSASSRSIAPIPVAVDTFPGTSGEGAEFPADFDAPAEIQALIDKSMLKAMNGPDVCYGGNV